MLCIQCSVVVLWLFSSHTRKRSRRKTREPYVPVVHDDVIKPVRQARSRHDDVIYPSLLVDDCARAGAAAGCRDCVCLAGFRVAGDSLAASDERPGGEEAAAEAVSPQRQRRRRATQLPCCVADCSCARRSSTSTRRKFTAVTTPFPTPPPPPPPPPAPATNRGKTREARACCGVVTTNSHDVATCTTSFNNDLMLHPPAVVDERLRCTSTDVASRETRNVTDQ